jgi:hypothetical protein
MKILISCNLLSTSKKKFKKKTNLQAEVSLQNKKFTQTMAKVSLFKSFLLGKLKKTLLNKKKKHIFICENHVFHNKSSNSKKTRFLFVFCFPLDQTQQDMASEAPSSSLSDETVLHRRLVFSFLEYLQSCSTLSWVETESLEVAVQCLGGSFGIDLNDPEHQKLYSIKPKTLLEIFESGLKPETKPKVVLRPFSSSSSSLTKCCFQSD